jgi:hypothetical protein
VDELNLTNKMILAQLNMNSLVFTIAAGNARQLDLSRRRASKTAAQIVARW